MTNTTTKLNDKIENLTCITLNIRGLKNKTKRISVFKLLKQWKYDVIALQETYLSNSDIPEVEKRMGWGVAL